MSAGLLQSAQGLLASLLGLAHTRLALLGTELQEELARFIAAVLGGLVVVALVVLGVGFGAAAIVISVGEEHRLAATGSFAALFLVLGLVIAWSIRHLVHARPRLLDASLTELERDYEALKR